MDEEILTELRRAVAIQDMHLKEVREKIELIKKRIDEMNKLL